jgi:transposase-like protein
VEDLLAERGIVVSYETVRRWVNHFGPTIAADFSSVHAQVYNHFNQELHLVTRQVYKERRWIALAEWRALAA